MAMTAEELRQFADSTLGIRIHIDTPKTVILQKIVNAAVAARDITWQ